VLLHDNAWLPGVHYTSDNRDKGEENKDTNAYDDDDDNEEYSSEDIDENELYKIIETPNNKGNPIWNQDENEEEVDAGGEIPEDQDVIGDVEKEATEEEDQARVQQETVENVEVGRDENVTVTRSGRVIKPVVRTNLL
jgi:hypothetical protein